MATKPYIFRWFVVARWLPYFGGSMVYPRRNAGVDSCLSTLRDYIESEERL